jgi:hypothetical protein
MFNFVVVCSRAIYIDGFAFTWNNAFAENYDRCVLGFIIGSWKIKMDNKVVGTKILEKFITKNSRVLICISWFWD